MRKAERSESLDLATIQRLALALGVEQARLMNTELDEAKIQVALDYIEAFNRRDPEAVAAIFHEEGSVTVMTDPGLPGGGLFAGKDGVKEWAGVCMEAMRMQPMTPEMFHIDVVGEYVLIRSIGDIRVDSRRTDRSVMASVAAEFRVRNSKALSLRIFADTLAISRLYQTDSETE